MLLRQFSVDEVPLGLERTTEDGVAGFLGRGLQLIEGGRRLQSRDIGGWEVEGGELGHLV